MLAIPDVMSNCAKLRSEADAPSGTPSSKIWLPDAPRSKPVSPLSSSARRSSFHVVSNWPMVRTWPNSYSRANLSKMFKLRTNARAEDDRVSPLMAGGELLSTPDITVERNACGDKPASGQCHHMTNTTQVADSGFLSRNPPL